MKFLRRATLIFAAMTVLDILWARYTIAIASRAPLTAGGWAAAMTFVNVYVVVSYLDDRRLIIPVAAGAFLGTFLATSYF